MFFRFQDADVVKLANTHGSGPCAARFVGSSPTISTILFIRGGNGFLTTASGRGRKTNRFIFEPDF